MGTGGKKQVGYWTPQKVFWTYPCLRPGAAELGVLLFLCHLLNVPFAQRGCVWWWDGSWGRHLEPWEDQLPWATTPSLYLIPVSARSPFKGLCSSSSMVSHFHPYKSIRTSPHPMLLPTHSKWTSPWSSSSVVCEFCIWMCQTGMPSTWGTYGSHHIWAVVTSGEGSVLKDTSGFSCLYKGLTGLQPRASLESNTDPREEENLGLKLKGWGIDQMGRFWVGETEMEPR